MQLCPAPPDDDENSNSCEEEEHPTAGGEVSDVARRQVRGTCSSPRAHHTGETLAGETLAGEDGSAHKREQLACWLGLAAGGEVSTYHPPLRVGWHSVHP